MPSITAVEVHAILRRTGTSWGAWAGICRWPKTGSGFYKYWDDGVTFNEYGAACHGFNETVFTEHYVSFANDPRTGAPWTQAGIDEKAWGVQLVAGCSGTGATRCTQVWIVIRYDDGSSQIYRPNEGSGDPTPVLTNDGDATYIEYTTSCYPFLGCDYNGGGFFYFLAAPPRGRSYGYVIRGR